MNQSIPTNVFNDKPGIWQVTAGHRFAIRDSLAKALLYAHEASMQSNAPTCILSLGTEERLDAYKIFQGWQALNLPLPQAAPR